MNILTTTPEAIVYKHLLFSHKNEVIKQLEALQRVAKRVGVPVPTWKLGDVYEYEFSAQVGFDLVGDADGQHVEGEFETFIEQVFDVAIYVEHTIKMPGDWKIAACISHEEGAIFQLDAEVEIPARFNPKIDRCDHCGRNFPRVKSFLIVNAEGEWRQLGKSCMKQFLGVNPTSYISMFEAVSKFSIVIESMGYLKSSANRMENLAYNVRDILAYVIGQVQRDGKFIKAEWKQEVVEEGYESRWGIRGRKVRNVRTNEGEATIDKVRDIISARSFYKFNEQAIAADASLASLEFLSRWEAKCKEIYQRLGEKHDAMVKALYAPKIDQNEREVKEAINEMPEVKEAKLKNSRAYNLYSELAMLVSRKKRHQNYLLSSADLQVNTADVEKVIAWAQELKIEKAFCEEDGQWRAVGFEAYKETIKDMFSKERTLQSNLKYLCTGYSLFVKDEQYKIQNADRLAKAATLKHVGVVGEKSHLVLTVVDVKRGSGNYGEWTLYTLRDADGNVFKKFGKLDAGHVIKKPEVKDIRDCFIGATIEALFEIKKHEQFKEEKVTQLGRGSKAKGAKYIV